MKRVGELVSIGSTAVAERPADNGQCHAYGCPLSGSISHSTLGGGRWYCRFHFGAEPRESDNITTELRKKARDGEPLDRTEPTDTVRSMREAVKARARRAA